MFFRQVACIHSVREVSKIFRRVRIPFYAFEKWASLAMTVRHMGWVLFRNQNPRYWTASSWRLVSFPTVTAVSLLSVCEALRCQVADMYTGLAGSTREEQTNKWSFSGTVPGQQLAGGQPG